MSNITQSACLNSTSLVYTYPSPLYPSVAPIVLDSADWDSHYLHTWIAKILLEERLGYSTWVNDAYTDPSATSLQRIDAGVVTANVEWWPSSDAAYLQYVTTARTVRDEGNLGVIGQMGLYTTRWTVRYYSAMMLEYYRWYKSDAQLAVPIFNASWAYLINPLTGQDMRMNSSGAYVCPDNATLQQLNLTLPFQGGCTGGMYIPPMCQLANMTSACLVMFHPDPFLDSGSVPALILSQKLPMVVAFISDFQAYVAYLAQVVHLPLIFFSQSPDPFLDLYCSNPTSSSNATSICFQRLLFASSDPSCDGETPGTTRTCDWPQLQLDKIASSATMRALTRVNTLITSLALKTADDKAMFVQLEANYPINGPKDYKAVACQWVRNNTAVWASWIAPPFACGVGDMYYTVGECGDKTTMPVTWAFVYPQACQGGLALPQGESAPCDVVPTSSRLYVSVVAVSCAVLLLPLLTAAVHGYTLLRMERPVLMVQQLAGGWLFVLSLGLLCLSLVPLVSVSGLSESVCQARVFLSVLGFTLSLLSLRFMCERLLKLMSSLLATSNPRREAWRVVAIAVLTLIILFLATHLSSSPPLLSMYTLTTPAGASINELYCQQPPLWSSALLIVGNGALALRCVEQLVRSVYALVMSARLYKDRPMAKLSHALQVHSLAWTLLVLVLAAAQLFYYTTPASADLNNSRTVEFIAAILLCTVPLCLATFTAPSFHLLRVIARRRADKARKKQLEAEHSKNTSKSKSESERGMELATLAGTLSDPLALLLFQQYAQSSLEGENIAFLLGIQTYVGQLKKDATTVQEVLDGAKELYLSFIADGAESQINISAKQRGELEADMKKLITHIDAAKAKAGAGGANVNGSLIKAALHKASNMPGQVAEESGEAQGGAGHVHSLSDDAGKTAVSSTASGGASGGENSYNFDFLKSVTTGARESISQRSVAPETSLGRTAVSVNGVTLGGSGSLSVTSKTAGPRLSAAAAWTGANPLALVASKELRNRAKAVFDMAVKEVFSLLTVNAWPRFLQSKQAQRANELLGWCGTFELYSDREQLGVLRKLRKMRQLSSQKRNSLTAPDGLVEHTHLSAGGSSYLHDKEESAALPPHSQDSTLGPLMSPSSRPHGSELHSSLIPNSSRKSSLTLTTPSNLMHNPRSSLIHPAPHTTVGGDEGEQTGSPPSVLSPCASGMGVGGGTIGTLTTGDGGEGGGTMSVALVARTPGGRGSLSGGGVPSHRNSTGLMSTAPSIAIKALMADDAIEEDRSMDSERLEGQPVHPS